MLKLGIIGAGTVFQNYISVLSGFLDKYRIVSVLDSDASRLAEAQKAMRSAGISGGVHFFSSFEKFIACDADAVLIATPPEAHFRLAFDCLDRGRDVLMEKPAVLSVSELARLYEKAHGHGALLHVAYHSSFAIDLRWFLDHRSTLTTEYGLNRISKIYCGFYDPYVVDGKLLSGKETLAGSYIDSGVNELSVCDRLIELDGFSCMNHSCQMDENRTVIASSTTFSNGEAMLYLDTGWIYDLNRKRTVIQFEDSEKQLVLDHSNQRVVLQRTMTKDEILYSFREQEEIELCHDTILLFEDASELRLNRHYMGVFTDFEKAYTDRKTNENSTEKIHRLLLGNASLPSAYSEPIR